MLLFVRHSALPQHHHDVVSGWVACKENQPISNQNCFSLCNIHWSLVINIANLIFNKQNVLNTLKLILDSLLQRSDVRYWWVQSRARADDQKIQTQTLLKIKRRRYRLPYTTHPHHTPQPQKCVPKHHTIHMMYPIAFECFASPGSCACYYYVYFAHSCWCRFQHGSSSSHYSRSNCCFDRHHYTYPTTSSNIVDDMPAAVAAQDRPLFQIWLLLRQKLHVLLKVTAVAAATLYKKKAANWYDKQPLTQVARPIE